MALTPEEKELIDTEEHTLRTVIDSLQTQRNRAFERLKAEEERARGLTAVMVATRRDEDKALLASDEAVSHGLKDQKKEETEIIGKLLPKPYFARIILDEDTPNGGTKEIEYKLGFAANPDTRIIDWRKAPISKLYYEYKEGDDYSEEILGRERSGRVRLRNRVEVEKGTLTGVHNRLGHFVLDKGEWRAIESKSGRTKASAGSLPEILSLITPSQFKMITEDAETAILIQGIAGSGKTTVALHRLAWLLHEDNSALENHECLIVVLSNTLKRYILNSLPSVGISGIKVQTFHEWAGDTIKFISGEATFQMLRPDSPAPHAVDRVKRSMALLKSLESYVAKQSDKIYKAKLSDLRGDILAILSDHRTIIENDETKLLDREVITAAFERTKANFRDGIYDLSDDALLLRLYEMKVGNIVLPDGKLGRLRHIVVDEVQDLSPLELACLVGATSDIRNMTIVGDTSQNLDSTATFPGWDKLQKHWNFKDSVSKYLSLTISHRSTLPIMKLADHIQDRSTVTDARMGRVPIWFKTKNEQHGIESVLRWLKKAQELYPNMLTAVICRDPEEAKFAYRMLQPTFGPVARLGDQYTFSFEEGIIITDVRQVKGLEFHSVLLWNPTSRSYPRNALSQNLLYVAVTRAEENLCLVTWQRPSDLLPPLTSRLVRGVDLTIEDEEEQQPAQE